MIISILWYFYECLFIESWKRGSKLGGDAQKSIWVVQNNSGFSWARIDFRLARTDSYWARIDQEPIIAGQESILLSKNRFLLELAWLPVHSDTCISQDGRAHVLSVPQRNFTMILAELRSSVDKWLWDAEGTSPWCLRGCRLHMELLMDLKSRA